MRSTFFLRGILIFTLLAGTLPAPLAVAAEPNVTIKLRPHCETSMCPDFALYDQETFITNGLDVGDMVDLDIVLSNPSAQPIQSVQSWLEYNPKTLKGLEVRISDSFPLVAPGEQAFSEESGRVKIGASNVSGGMKESEIVFARVKFEVLKESEEILTVGFHEFSLLGQEGKTKVLVIEEGRTANVLKTRPNKLRLYFGNNPPPSITPGPPSTPPGTTPPGNTPPTTTPFPTTPPPTQPPPTIPPGTDTSFTALQPQGLRVMTEDDKVYLIWNPVTDPRVIGYNIYYGTVSGRYIQRRTVSTETTGVTIRNLPVGTRYYFAVTAFNQMGQDSEYSFEVAVTVGDPDSSTAPFTLTPGNGGTPIDGSVIGGNGSVPGGTGLPMAAMGGVAAVSFGVGAFSFLRRRKSSSRS